VKRIVFIGLLLTSLVAVASNWIASNLIQAKQLGEVNGFPVWQCTYRVGEEGNITFSIRSNQQECQGVVFYNIETNQWAKQYPNGNPWVQIYRF